MSRPRAMLVSGYTELQSRVRNGELGSIPVVLGLVVIWLVFQTQNSSFLSAENLSNLAQQMAATGTIALGIVLVLLIGEIDLSVGSVSGVTSAILAVMNVNNGMAAIPAILLALAAGLAIGAIHGFFFSRLGVPSFVVTLAGLIGWSGLQLTVLGQDGTINLAYNGGIAKLANTYYVAEIGYGIVIAITLAYAAVVIRGRRRRIAAGLEAVSLQTLLLRAALLGAALVVVVAVMNSYRGLPLALVIFGGLVIFFDLMLRHTVLGRRIFAVGGNAEAARRSGINVARVRFGVMMVASMMAAAGGVLAASRLYAVNQSSGASDVLLNAIAAAVIGGTSLFGGRGSAYSALLGILVIQSIANGMLLLSLGTDVRFMVTGGVLLAAVTIDALARRGQAARGLA
ncbi:MAG: D-xylose transport system permease protein [Solirubrobacterales bacterium]|nr:D-xylose transport system permease protein [Solirubrobacterales bacterium]